MDLRYLEEILNEQREEILLKADMKICARREEALVNLESRLAQVVMGVRRSGKSTLCYHVLALSGKRFAYVNFDDERLKDIGSNALDDVLQVLYKINGDFNNLFLDEIQNVDGWQLFVNRLLRRGIKIVITGSNAKLLSSELATHLTGRHHSIELLPFSFSEFCEYKGLETTNLTTKKIAFLRQAFDRYLENGGFPETFDEQNNADYVNDLVKSIVERDIIQRYKVRYKSALTALTQHLLNNAPCVVVNTELQKLLRLQSDHTVDNYVGYLERSYLISTLCKFSTKSALRMRNKKCYPIDVSLMNNRQNAFAGLNLGWRLETIVFLELKRRCNINHHDLFYFNDGRHEIDFVECNGNNVIRLYQVSYDISNKKTFDREINALEDVSKLLHCNDMMLITDHERRSVELRNGATVNVVPAYLWLVDHPQ